MTTDSTGMLKDEGGYVTRPQDALTRWPTQAQTNWLAADPPRVWDMIRHEDDDWGWDQVAGLRALAGLLTVQADRLSRHRAALSQLWPAEQSPTAAMALERIDKLIRSMRSDSERALRNALAIDGIMTATAKAKREVYRIVQQWELTTHEGGPEWWDHEAARLSYVTEQTMVATERAIRDHRAGVIMPTDWRAVDAGQILLPPDNPPDDDTTTQPVGGPTTRYAGTPRPAPPTLPGYPPMTSPLRPGPGPDLQGVEPPVPAIPGQPVSMLPIAPGNTYAPYGGAYVLPGPGVGPNGYVVALPKPGSGAAPTVSAQTSRGAGGLPGMMPLPIGGTPGSPGNRGGGESYRRSPDTKWIVSHGVKPVIEPDRSSQAHEASDSQVEEDFRRWFTQTAMPWRETNDEAGPAPTVTIRRGAPAP